MHLKKVFLVVFVFTLLSIAGIKSASAQKESFTVESGVIPPEFNKGNDTLLIYASNPFYAGSMKKHFRKSGYTGEYETTTKPEKYSVEHCRYILYEITSSTNITTFVQGSPSQNTTRTRVQTEGWYIKDRVTGKNYLADMIPMPKLIHKYIAALDEARKK